MISGRSNLDIENPCIMEKQKFTVEELEMMISECQKKLALAHKMLMEDENTDEERKRLEEETRNLHNRVFRFQHQLRRSYTEEFSKSADAH